MADTWNYRGNYVTDGRIGIDLTATYASTSAGSTSLMPAKPGDRVAGSNGSVWVFTRAASTIAQFDVVSFGTFAASTVSSDQTVAPTVQAVPLTVAGIANGGVANSGAMVGIAQNSIDSAYYGWIAINGYALRCSVKVSCKPKVMLFATSTAGSLDDATTSVAYISGITINTSATSASAPWCVANYPHIDVLEVG